MGGLNDVLCQIGKSIAYAERFHRLVVVDTNYPDCFSLGDDLSEYFRPTSATISTDLAILSTLPTRIDCVPPFLTGRLSTYGLAHDEARNRAIDAETAEPITFDFTRNYDAQVLVHHAFGGGEESLTALARLALTDRLRSMLRERIAAIGGAYSAIHIRATDYRSDFEAGLRLARKHLHRRVFVATDNADALDCARAVLEGHAVYSFSALPSSAGEPLHGLSPNTDRFDRNADAILDLVTLALAARIYAFKLEASAYGAPPPFSGYSTLAVNLHRSPGVLRNLVGADFAVRGPTWRGLLRRRHRRKMMADGILAA